MQTSDEFTKLLGRFKTLQEEAEKAEEDSTDDNLAEALAEAATIDDESLVPTLLMMLMVTSKVAGLQQTGRVAYEVWAAR